jgi:ribosomal protein L29
METPNLTLKSPKELQRELGRLREQLRDKRFKISQGQNPHVRELRVLKRSIAQILTKLTSHAR